jgi:DNA-directed RNA polymerase specialized sigma24 family protein
MERYRYFTRGYLVVAVPPDTLAYIAERVPDWREKPEDIAAGLAWGREKKRLLAWVQETMKERLTEREQFCLYLHFFRGITYEAIAKQTNTNRSSVYRAAQRGIRRLREAAHEQGIRPKLPRRMLR